MSRKKNLRRVSVLVTPQTLYNLERLADTVSSWENGKTKPSLDNFRKLCALYDCKEEEIKL